MVKTKQKQKMSGEDIASFMKIENYYDVDDNDAIDDDNDTAELSNA